MSKPRHEGRGPRSSDKVGGSPGTKAPAGQDRGWDPVAAWYDKLVGDTGSDYHRQVILPAAMRLLEPKRGEAVIDVCCGQGVLAPVLLDAGCGAYHGVDASPRLIAAAKARYGNDKRVQFTIADASKPGEWADGAYDAAACLMAVHDLPDVLGLMQAISAGLKTGGRAVLIFMHPCFRIPKRSHWGFDNDQKIQYRRLDSYGSEEAIPVTTHPGQESSSTTLFYHRPLAQVINAIGSAGMAVNSTEELYSHRRSQGTGPFSRAEHKAAGEFPLFIGIRAIKV